MPATDTPPDRAAHHSRDRQTLIRQARQAWLDGPGGPLQNLGLTPIEPWITRSWQRCLADGLRPHHRVEFGPVSAATQRQLVEGNRELIDAARPVLAQLSRAIAGTRYFSLLTNAQGVVVDVHGPIDPTQAAATTIARVGVDLSERQVGTTAIGAALTELQPVWLHQGEHFFDQNAVYSCAGAPLIGPEGDCVGMLDLTGVEVPERPELRHLVTRAARHIENALVLQSPWHLLLRLNWPGAHMPEGPASDTEGLLCLDAEGTVLACNPVGRQMLPRPLLRPGSRLQADDLFALPWGMLVDHARREAPALDVPLWSGLRLQALARLRGATPQTVPAGRHDEPRAARPLRELETALIRQAVEQARGNVAEAAQRLGISRATVYRKLGQKARTPGH
ncbi:MAG: GAF domain-containing protein [Curvibacter sp.]|nr:MAG: GAF domain-containing protein [Curvibacter sp.]